MNYEKISERIFSALLFLLPIFAVPLITISPVAGKSFLLYIGIALATLFWLISLLQKGELKIPKSFLFIPAGALAVFLLMSSLLSGYKGLSFFGRGYETDTFLFFLFILVAMFLISIFYQSAKKAILFYGLIAASAVFVFVFQVLHIFWGINPFNLFPYTVSNLVGGWNDFFVFFGFVALVALIFVELLKSASGVFKGILFGLIFMSLLGMLAAANFTVGWLIFGAFVLFFLVYLLSGSLTSDEQPLIIINKKKILSAAFLVFLITILVIFNRNASVNFTNKIKTTFVEARMPIGVNAEVAKKEFGERPLFGSGPNTFMYEWLKLKPSSFNESQLGNIRFSSGSGYLPTLFVTGGLIGGALFIVFFLILLSYGMKALTFHGNELQKAVLVSSYFGAVYLWIFALFYSSNAVIFALAFLLAGLFLAVLVSAEKLKTLEIRFFKTQKTSFVSILIIVVLLVGAVSFLYVCSQKILALYNFEKAISIFKKEGNFEKTESRLINSIKFDAWGEQYRTLSELYLLKAQQMVSGNSKLNSEEKNKLQNILQMAVKSAQESIKINGYEPTNWLQLGKIYEFVSSLGVSGAGEMAIASYAKISEISPADPIPYFLMGRLNLQMEKYDLSQAAFEKAVSITPSYSNARYFLGLIYEKKGMKEKAIEQFEEVAKANPDNAEVRKILQELRK